MEGGLLLSVLLSGLLPLLAMPFVSNNMDEFDDDEADLVSFSLFSLSLLLLGSSLVSMRSSAAMMSPRFSDASVLTRLDSETFLTVTGIDSWCFVVMC